MRSCFFFCYKQKTAYELRISDWSSDVCSSDLVAFMLGGAILIDTDVPQFQISWPAIASVAIASLALTVVIARLALVSRRRKIFSGREAMIGASGPVLDWNNGTGPVFAHGESWQAAGGNGRG